MPWTHGVTALSPSAGRYRPVDLGLARSGRPAVAAPAERRSAWTTALIESLQKGDFLMADEC